MPLQFGINIDPAASGTQLALELAREADQLGLDLIGFQDHPYNPEFLDTWTLMSFLGAATERVQLMSNVANLPLRPPAMLAKAAASLDILTGGRVELGLGAGAIWPQVAAYGGPDRSSGGAVQALEEAIRVMHAIWGDEGEGVPVSFSGAYYNLSEAQPGPRPVHPIRIWLGALGPRMLQLTGRLADGWSVSENWVPPERVAESWPIIAQAAEDVGRDPNEIRRNYNMMGSILRGADSRLRARQPGVRIAPAEEWVDALVRFSTDLALDTFIYWPVAGSHMEQTRLWAEEVVPRVREQVGEVGMV